MDVPFVLLVIGGLIVVGLMAYGAHLADQRRREYISRAAASRGWTYVARDDSLAERFQGAPFEDADDCEVTNIVSGVHDRRRFTAFDLTCTTRTIGADGKSRTDVDEYSVIALSTKVVMPDLEVVPENLVGRLFGRILGTDIELESEQFNRAFTVTCDDRKFATDVLHPQMMEHLLTRPDLGWSLTSGTVLVATLGEHTLTDIEVTLRFVDGILDRVPSFVWKQLGTQDPGAEA